MTCNSISNSNQFHFLEQDIGGIPFDDDFVREQERIEAEKTEKKTHKKKLEEDKSEWKDHVIECAKCKKIYEKLDFKNKTILNQSLVYLSLQNALYHSKDEPLTEKNTNNLMGLFITELTLNKHLDETSSIIYAHVLNTVFPRFRSIRQKMITNLLNFH